VIVYVSIGNSDDKLSQAEWSEFLADVLRSLRHHASEFHGYWLSSPESRWQNAVYCAEFRDDRRWPLAIRMPAQRDELARLAAKYRQDSIAWNESASTELVGARS